MSAPRKHPVMSMGVQGSAVVILYSVFKLFLEALGRNDPPLTEDQLFDHFLYATAGAWALAGRLRLGFGPPPPPTGGDGTPPGGPGRPPPSAPATAGGTLARVGLALACSAFFVLGCGGPIVAERGAVIDIEPGPPCRILARVDGGEAVELLVAPGRRCFAARLTTEGAP